MCAMQPNCTLKNEENVWPHLVNYGTILTLCSWIPQIKGGHRSAVAEMKM